MRKKWLLALTLSAVIFTISGCGKTAEEATEGTTEETTAGTSMTEYKSKLVKLGEYKGLTYTKVDVSVADEEIQAELDNLLKNNMVITEITDRTIVEDGDVANIDFQGFVDGETSDNMTGEGFDLTIGSGQFIDGFEAGLIGQEVGTECVLDLKFPEVYQAQELQGKDVEFHVTINKIQQAELPELTDEFIQEVTEAESIEAYKTQIKEDMLAYREDTAAAAKEAELLENLIAASEFEMNEADYTDIITAFRSEYEYYAASMGVDMETFVATYMGTTMEDFDAKAKEMAEIRVQNALIMFAIVEAEELTLTDEEYAEGLQGLFEQYGASNGIEDIATFETTYTKAIVEEELLYNRAFDIIVENAVEAE